MFKKLTFLLIITIVISFVIRTPSFVSARTYYYTTSKIAMPSPIATPTPVPVVNSFDLFWPMVAGRTMQSKIYFLKILKEKIRGFFIFGSAQKADYDIFLGIKRMLEAEVLMKANVPDLANKTLDSAKDDLNKANSILTNAKNASDIDQGTKDEINSRVDNLKKFLNSLISQYPNYKSKLQSILDKLGSINA